MELGSKVEVISDFTELGETWDTDYPKIGEILTVSSVSEYDGSVDKFETDMLTFHEYPNLSAICERRHDNVYNFKLVDKLEGHMLMMDIATIPTDINFDIDRWNYIMRNQGVLFYDGSKGNKPEIIQMDVKDIEIQFYDVSEQIGKEKLHNYIPNKKMK